MNESQRAMHRLIEEVVSLSEGTRFLARSEDYRAEALRVVRGYAGAVLQAVDRLGGAMDAGSEEALDRPRESAEVVISGGPAAPVGAPVDGLGDLFAE